MFETSTHKQRIENVFDMINPGILNVFGTNMFSNSARIFYQNFSNPLTIAQLEKDEFIKKFQQLTSRKFEEEKINKIYNLTLSNIKIYIPMIESGSLPFDFAEEEKMVQTEMQLISVLEGLVHDLDKEIEMIYQKVDNHEDLRSIQGIGKSIAPIILGLTGDVDRFRNIKCYRKFCGFCPKKKESSNHDVKGLGIDKAAQGLLKFSLYMAAETARHWDAEFASFYDRLKRRGFHHIGAMSALANKLAGRVYSVLKRVKQSNSNYGSIGTNSKDEKLLKDVKYKQRDLNGNTISKKEAREIIVTNFSIKSQLPNEKKASSYHPIKILFPKQPAVVKTTTNSSIRSSRTRPSKDILNDMLSSPLFQDLSVETDDKEDIGKKKLLETLHKFQVEVEQDAVDKLCTSNEKNIKNNT